MLDPLLGWSSILNVTLQKLSVLLLATKANSSNFPSREPHFLKKDFNQKHNAVNYIFFQQFGFQPCFSNQLLCLRLMFLPEVLNEYWKFDMEDKRQQIREEENGTESLLKAGYNLTLP